MTGRLVCWLVRAFGGAHKERRVKVNLPLLGQVNRRCTRCGAVRLAKERKRKVAK